MRKMRSSNSRSLYFSDSITEAMNGFLEFPLIIVEAPMGYGKTTFVREGLKNIEADILWQKVCDSSIRGFWRGFCRQLEGIDCDIARNLSALGIPSDSIIRNEALSLLEDMKLQKDTVLVIDDYHFVACPETNDFIDFLVKSEIQNLHLILIARHTGLQSIEELKLKGYLLHIRKESFEFSKNDIKAYYQLCGILLKETEMQMLYDLTEGWISALYLIMLNYRGSGSLDSCKDIGKLIENAVYRHFSDEIKELLLALSIFEGFNLEQAVFVSKNEDAWSLLSEVISNNAFVKFDSSNKTYQIHNIFMEFLQEELKSRNMQNDLYQSAAQWFLKIGDYNESMRYYYLTKDFEQLLFVMEEEIIKFKDKYFENDIDVLVNYLEECPASIRARHHVAMLMYTHRLQLFNKGELFRKACVELIDNIHSDESLSEATRNQYLGEYEIVMMFSAYNNIGKMMHQVLKADELLHAPSILFDNKSTNTTFGSPSVLYLFYSETGKLEEHTKELLDAFPCYQKIASRSGSGQEYIMESERYFNMGDFENAEISIHKAIIAAENFSQTQIIICAMFMQIRIAFIKGDLAGILEIFEKMHEKIENNRAYFFIHTIEICEGYIYSLIHKTDKIPEWLINGDFKNKRLMTQVIGMVNLVYGRVLLLKGDYHKLIGSMENFIGIASIFPNPLGQIYTYIYVSAANWRIYRKREAITRLTKALELAMPDELYMPFVENCDYIKPILEEIHRDGGYRDDIERILKLYEPYHKSIDKMEKELLADRRPKLSEREMEIARLAASGLTNKEIGEKLFISANTVKMALKSIYSKLSINSRLLIKEYLDSL